MYLTFVMLKASCPILIAEDDPNDVYLLQHAFEAASLEDSLHFVSDGQEAIEYLRGTGKFANRSVYPLPGLVLLDLKMPRRTGFEVIEWMRGQSQWKLIPIVILSASAIAEDVNRAYTLGANAYMVKPAELSALKRLIATIGEFWSAGEIPQIE
jgi:CheY-like chemotaxis protein